MIYICKACGFLFERADIPDACPNCAKEYILPANDEEQKEFQKRKREFGGTVEE